MDSKLFKVGSIGDLTSAIAEIRSLRKGFITNFYLDPAKQALWIAKGDCFTEIINESLFIIKRSSLFWNVFYCSTALEQLISDLQVFQMNHSMQTAMFDIVGHKEQCVPIVEAFQTCNCEFVASLVRMKRMTADMSLIDSSDQSVLYADENSIPEINNLLHAFFNERTEQIPYFEELIIYSRRKQILVCEESGVLIGFLIFEPSPSSLYLRYWFIHPEYREKRVGSRLIRRFFEEGRKTKRQILWVVQSNENAIKRYRHYGFTEENMYDFVLQFN